MRVAIVHDWLVTWGGAENVLALFLARFPQAELFTIVDFLPPRYRHMLRGRTIHTSFIQKLPRARSAYRNYLPLMPFAVEQFDLNRFDLVISSSHAVAKGVLVGPDTRHLCYCYSPMRYAWDMQWQYLEQTGHRRTLKGALMRWQLHYLRRWDYLSAQRPDEFVAISHYIKRRVAHAWRRSAHVIYPPVDVERFCHKRDREDFYVTAGRLVPYKRFDLVVRAFEHFPAKRLIVIGDGPERSKLERMAGSNVEFIGYREDAELADYLQRCLAFIFMAEEDFGILPLEAQASGAPVIGYRRGGLGETIQEGESGVLIEEQSVESLVEAVGRFEHLRSGDRQRMNASNCRLNAERFTQSVFLEEFEKVI